MSPCHPSTLISCTPSDALKSLLPLLADIAYRPRKLDRPATRPPPSDAGEPEGQVLPLESALAPVGQEMDPEEDVDEQYKVSVLASFCTSAAYPGFWLPFNASTGACCSYLCCKGVDWSASQPAVGAEVKHCGLAAVCLGILAQ